MYNGVTMERELFESLKFTFEKSDPEIILSLLCQKFSGDVGFSTSFSVEDQVITHMLARYGPQVKIFTLDTGRLPEETYRTLESTREYYGLNIEIFFPDYNSVEKMVAERGINLFYRSVEDRKRCCFVRKVEPLQRALKGVKVWITGLRREQSVTRSEISVFEYDEAYHLYKCNPLWNWTESEVWEYIRNNNVPYNSLYDKGYRSIGCEPCTRAVQEGEDVRAGRWWWEHPETKECGLHVIR